MKKDLKEHAERFDEIAEEYDENHGPKYQESLNKVIKYADPRKNEVVLDIGTGTGAIALNLSDEAKKVIGVDISEEMLKKAKEKIKEKDLNNVEIKFGSFLELGIKKADLVVSNFAMHHLNDEDKVRAINNITNLEPRKIVLGDLMFFEEPKEEKEPFYDPEVDDPARISLLLKAFTDNEYAITEIEKIHPELGVIVAERKNNHLELSS